MKREIDTTKPQIGRIYDYFLGGVQNFEADRFAAEAVLKIFPSARSVAQLQRWWLHLIADRWAGEGRTDVFDLGSGLPTQGHFDHYITNGRILFSDFDVLTVEYAQDLLKDRPNVRYVLGDAREPSALIESAAGFFGANRRLAVGLIGVSYFLLDDDLRRLAQALDAFCAPGSVLAMSYFLPPPPDGPVDAVQKKYKAVTGAQLYTRTSERVAELLSPWRVTEERTLMDWVGVDNALDDQDRLHQTLVMGLLATR